MTRFILAAAAALIPTASFAGPAVAPPAPPPVIVPVQEPFEGAYIGLEFGHVMGEGESTNGVIGANNFTQTLDFENGTAWGAFAGYNMQNGSIVYGGEARYLHLNGFGDGTGDYEIPYVADLRARIGYVAGDVMFYGAAGLSVSEYNSGVMTIDLTGYNVGVGAEYNISDSFFVRADFTARQLTGETVGMELDQTLNTVTIGAGFRF